jgi:hypothetical protein
VAVEVEVEAGIQVQTIKVMEVAVVVQTLLLQTIL